jgi:CDP-diacylglycerol pyrophosphatase
MAPFITTEIYRTFHNSRPREKGHLPTTISCQKIETKNLLKNRNKEFTTAFITELQDL